jgi:membrane protein implicated in regulation of membrane protease activity
MIRILEIAWLIITIITAGTAGWQLFDEGIQSALWMFVISAVAFAMYLVRRKQRISIYNQEQHQQDDATRYH